jgi:hypothetical protein
VKPPPIAEPFTRPEILRDLEAVRAWCAEFWGSFGVDEFFAPMGEAWSPADNVRHLIKSNRPVAKALGLPRAALLLRFGFALRPSRPYSKLRATYHEALASGLRAGDYSPKPLPASQQSGEERERILNRWAGSLSALGSAAQGWSEGSLDRLRLPHPGLGMLTVREMLFFTLYHNTHHVLGVAQRKQSQGEL